MSRSQLKSPRNLEPLSRDNGQGTIITFYSYKGGTGRSMALANVSWILASAGKRVLAIDWDLEAPGLHRYFSPFLRDKKLSATEGIINFADEYRQKAMTPPADRNTLPENWYLEYADLSHYAVRLNWDFGNGYLDFVPAGQQDEDYSGLVNSFNWKTFFVDLGGNRLLDATKELLRDNYDYILIDSRTGVSDTSGICTVKMPDILVVCFTLNNQSIDGAASVANDVHSQRLNEIKIFPVPMRLDNGEIKKLETRSEYARDQFLMFPNYTGARTKTQYWKDIPIYYVSYYAYDEVLAAFGEKDPKVVSMLASAERLTSYLTDGSVDNLEPPPEALRLKKLAEFEGVELAMTPADKISEAAQSNFSRLSAKDQEKARRVLLRLVRVPRPNEKADPSRQRIDVNDLGEEGSTIVSKLRDSQIIQRTGWDDNGNAKVEIINDELLRGWPELHKWIREDREFLWWRQQLPAEMVEWKQQKHSEGWLAAHATDNARRWLETRPDDLTKDEVKFLTASVSALKKRRLKFAITTAAILGLFVIIVFSPSIIRQRLKSKADRDDAQKLATEAQNLIDAALAEPAALGNDRIQLGVLLALESQRLVPSDATKAILDRGLSRLIAARRIASLPSDSSVVRIAWSPDGQRITMVTGRARDVDPSGVSSSTREDRAVEVREIASGKRLSGPIPFKPGVQRFSISSDGRYLAFSRIASAGDGTRANKPPSYAIEILDLTTGEQTLVDTRRAQIYSLVFSPDSKRMITTGIENTAVLIDVENRKRLRPIRHQGIVTAAVFSPDSQFVATASDDYYARVWRVSDPEGSRTATDPIKTDGVVSKVLFTPDQRRLITLSYLSGKNYAEMWELEGKQQVRFSHPGIAVDVAISADGRYIATLGEDGEIRLWDAVNAMARGSEITPLRSFPTIGNVNRIRFSPGTTNYIVAIGDRATVGVLRLPDSAYAVLGTNESSVNAVAFNAAGSIALATESVQVWQLENGISSNPCQHVTRPLSVDEWQSFLPNRTYLQICSDVRNGSPQ